MRIGVLADRKTSDAFFSAIRRSTRSRLPPLIDFSSAVFARVQTRRACKEGVLAGPDSAHQAPRSRSLMLVFERVCASTRLTITAQYSEYLPSAEGRLPETTTEPAGMRP